MKASVGNYGGVCILDRETGVLETRLLVLIDQPLVDLQMQSYKTSRYIDQEGTFYHDGTAYPDMTDVIQINEYCALNSSGENVCRGAPPVLADLELMQVDNNCGIDFEGYIHCRDTNGNDVAGTPTDSGMYKLFKETMPIVL